MVMSMRDLNHGIDRTRARRGFTLIEMLVVLSVIALLLSLVAPAYISHIDRAQELTLRQNLKTTRATIDQFHADRARDPVDLAELVTTHYLRDLPVDPVTDRNDTWVPVMVDGAMHDLHSGAAGKGNDGTPYASW
jgi:general secretion pathway protein G